MWTLKTRVIRSSESEYNKALWLECYMNWAFPSCLLLGSYGTGWGPKYPSNYCRNHCSTFSSAVPCPFLWAEDTLVAGASGIPWKEKKRKKTDIPCMGIRCLHHCLARNVQTRSMSIGFRLEPLRGNYKVMWFSININARGYATGALKHNLFPCHLILFAYANLYK